MQLRIKRSAALLLLTVSTALYGEPPATQPASETATLPVGWIGHWKGEARYIAGNKVMQTFITELVIRPTADPMRYEWTLIYDGKTGRQERAYTLVVKDAAKGAYEIDEGQGIILPATLLGDLLTSSFDVMGNRIDATYELRTSAHGTSMEMRLVTKKSADAITTGGKDGVPDVTAWTPISLQTCTLRRID